MDLCGAGTALCELGVPFLVFVLLAAFLGGAAQSTLGFGAGFTTVPALALVAPVLLPGSVLVAMLPLSLVMVLRAHRDLDRRAFARLSLGRFPGILAGVAVVSALPVRGLTALIAVILLLAVVASAFGWELTVTPRREVVAGLLSGVTGTAAALGGPPLALLYRGRSGRMLRPTLAAVWVTGIVPGLALLGYAGEFTREQAVAGGTISVAVLAGLGVGVVVVRAVPDVVVRRAVLWWAGLGSVLALGRVLYGV